jgi:outer membrane protein OmpA-like peptidoglycan-associated protein
LALLLGAPVFAQQTGDEDASVVVNNDVLDALARDSNTENRPDDRPADAFAPAAQARGLLSPPKRFPHSRILLDQVSTSEGVQAWPELPSAPAPLPAPRVEVTRVLLVPLAGDGARRGQFVAAPPARELPEIEMDPPLSAGPERVSAPAETRPAAASTPPESIRIAKAEPEDSPAATQTTALRPAGDLRLLFPENSANLSDAATNDLKSLAESLLKHDTQRVQLLAYARGTRETASQARRLSLSRALSVRTFLIDQGVSSTRIDVRALGNKAGDEPRDRLDIRPIAR